MRHVRVFWLADGIYSLPCCSALRLEHKSPGVYWNIHIWLDITHTFGILVYLRSSVSSQTIGIWLEYAKVGKGTGMPIRNQKKRGHGEWPFSQPRQKWKHSSSVR